jgi:heme oxygenase
LTPAPASTGGILDEFREHTAPLHRQAERSGVIHEILQRRASPSAYALLLRNLLPVYAVMERALERHKGSNALGALALPALYRRAAIRMDLRALRGPGWQRALPLLPSGARYARRIASAVRSDPALLVAHAYTRYLGDLNGGQIMQRLLEAAPGIGPQALSFHGFPQIADPARFRLEYRLALERAAATAADRRALVDEAARAFQLNIALSEEVRSSPEN